MRKLLPFFLAFAMIVCFAACKDKNEPTNPAIGTSTPSGSGSDLSSSSQNVSAGNTDTENLAQTYVLTTTPDMTVPSVATTEFNPANEAASTDPFTTQNVTTDFTLTVAPITAPVVNSSALPSVPTVSSTAASSASGNSENFSSSAKTTTKKQESTTSASAKAVNIMDAGVGLDGSGKRIVYSIDPSCGNFKSNSTVITVTVDGEEYDNIPCKISASNIDASGCQQIFIDLSGVEDLESGSTVSFSVPSAFLTSKDGKTYSRSFGNTIIV